MTTPAYPNPISLGDVLNEFGTANLGQAYAGAGYVPAGTIGYPFGNATLIPSSGPISLANFWGASKAPPPPFPFMRGQIRFDRYALFRFYVVQIPGFGILSLEAPGNTLYFGTPNEIIWLQYYNIIPGSAVPGMSVSLSIENKSRNFGNMYIYHQPTASEPYVDIFCDDESPRSFVDVQFLLTMQLAAGQSQPAPYNGSLYNDGTWGVPPGDNRAADAYPCSATHNGYPNGTGGFKPRIYNGYTQAQPPFGGFPEPFPDNSTPCENGEGGTG